MGLFRKKQPAPTPTPQPPPVKVDQSGSPTPQPVPQTTSPQYHQPFPQPPAYQLLPQGWNSAPPPLPAAGHYHDQRHYPPIIVNQHYYLSQAAPYPPHNNPYPNNNGSCALSKLKLGSAVDLVQLPGNVVNQIFDDELPRWHAYGTQLLNQGAACYDQILSKFDNVMTLIDREKLNGNEEQLFMYQPPTPGSPPAEPSESSRGLATSKNRSKPSKKDAPKGQTTAVASTLISGGYFAKVDLYANSKLPTNLPPLRLYIPTYPLLCLAAQYSERVYEQPRGAERDAHVNADWKTGTKAMCIKSVPMDHMDTIVFAIRGTATFMDWAVNLNTAPTAPVGFLDDASNLCHSGFLSVARKMIAPVAARLRQLLEEDPGRCSSSLLITGHSAGGAVASLLYMHMLAKTREASTELNHLTGCFKRVHCVTFGTPPISLFPLQKPDRAELNKSLFISFINEGDPVARADKAYVKSLLELFAAPAPTTKKEKSSDKLLLPSSSPPKPNKPKEKKSKASLASKASKMSMKSAVSSTSHSSSKPTKLKPLPGPIWKVPPSTLSNAGRIVILRSGDPHARVKRAKTVEQRLNEGVVAQVANDEQLRGVIWGDPVCHVMKLYAGRIEVLAVGAVTAKGY